MLEAVLSARRVLYLSWAGRSVRDNSSSRPRCWCRSCVTTWPPAGPAWCWRQRTTEHPLQPFSRRYFERPATQVPEAPHLFTHAREWRAAHEGAQAPTLAATAPLPEALPPLTVATLARFLKNPVKEFFRQQLGVVLREEDAADEDDEVLSLGGLPTYQLLSDALAAVLASTPDATRRTWPPRWPHRPPAPAAAACCPWVRWVSLPRPSWR
jgi:exodeoxyribonuclease V gamma subunit